ncbi:MAG: HAMP domain-containing histidine kinase, partial [Clostridia bacterium]|nr:HAMP domain-containing histidine kinase [Clostridia bacterium]
MSAKKKQQLIRRWGSLRWRLTLFVFSILLSSGLLAAFVFLLLTFWAGGSPALIALIFNPTFMLIILLLSCTAIGTILANRLGTYYLRPLKRLIEATREVKNGNFKVQVNLDKKTEKNIARLPSEMEILVESFNDMVHELDDIELFRNDFINNFSHEFKTPIVSIRGFARELQKENLTEEQRQEYATIIAEEADRLAKLSTNVLELSKLENQQ